MLVLLLCAVMSEWFQPGVLTQAHLSLAVRADRAYKESPANFTGQFLVSLFRIGTLAMALCLCFPTQSGFPFAAFGLAAGLIIAVWVIKMLCNRLLDYIFMLSRRFGPVNEHYGNLFTMAAGLLYPALLFLIRFGNTRATRWTVAVVAVLFMLVWTYRALRTYSVAPVAVIYIVLYMCTLELLPMAVIVYLSEKTMVIL